MTPSRADLINSYWLDGLSHKKIAKKYCIGRPRLARLFQQHGVLSRKVGGRGGRNKIMNRVRLELMLLPSVDEWRELAREVRG